MYTFKAKIDLILFVPVMLIMLGCTLPAVRMIMTETNPKEVVNGWIFFAFMIATMAFCMNLFLNTHYRIDADKLIVRSGILINKSIEISSIRKINKTRSIISAPAPSLDRLELFYNKFDSVIISPKEKGEFIKALIKINPDIEVCD